MANDESKFVSLYAAIINGAKTYSDVAIALGYENDEPVKELYKLENKEKRERVLTVKNLYERKRRDDATKKYEEGQVNRAGFAGGSNS